MAHYALLDENNKVVQVITGIDETELIEGKHPEQWYGEFHNMRCKRTSFNTLANGHINGGIAFRGNYAGIGYTYDEILDVFIPPQPYSSWKLNYEKFDWEPPIQKPELEEGCRWIWSEPNKEWVKITKKSS